MHGQQQPNAFRTGAATHNSSQHFDNDCTHMKHLPESCFTWSVEEKRYFLRTMGSKQVTCLAQHWQWWYIKIKVSYKIRYVYRYNFGQWSPLKILNAHSLLTLPYLFQQLYYTLHNFHKVRLILKRSYHWPRRESMTIPKRLLKPQRKFLPLVPVCDSNAVHTVFPLAC